MKPFSRNWQRVLSGSIMLATLSLYIVQGASGPTSLAIALNAPSSGGVPCMRSPSVGWNVVPAPDAGSYSNALYGITSISPGDAWAVGEQYSSYLGAYIAIIEHWNGAAWSVVQGSPYALNLRGVAALASNDVWAVGWMGGYRSSPLTEHWDGSQWTYVMASASGGRKLYGVAAISPDDVWAVGQSSTGVLIMHWNGTQWSAAAVPTITGGVLYSVTAASRNDIWAVGTLNNAETLALHWDGTQWTRFPTPNDGAYINVLTSASAVTSDDIWAVGYWATSGVDYHGYTLHWNGSAWNSVANPANPNQQSKPGDDPIPTGAYLYGVAATKKGEVWAVGRNLQNTGTTGVIFGLRSGKWSAMDNPNPGYANTKLYAVDASPGNAWAVGSFDTNSYGYTVPLTERYSGGCITDTPGR